MLSRRVLDRTWPILAAKSAQNDPKMVPQNDPKLIKNGGQKIVKILIVQKRGRKQIWVWPADCVGLLGGKEGG